MLEKTTSLNGPLMNQWSLRKENFEYNTDELV